MVSKEGDCKLALIRLDNELPSAVVGAVGAARDSLYVSNLEALHVVYL